MSPRPFIRILVCAAAAVLALCCTRPDSVETFVRKGEAKDGRYEFAVDLSDSLRSYDFWFYTRIDGPAEPSLGLDIRWTAPDGRVFAEKVYMRTSSGGCREMYRRDVSVPLAGEWKLSVRPDGPPRGFCGLGFVYKRN